MGTAELSVEELVEADRLWHWRRAALAQGLGLEDLKAVAKVTTERVYPKDAVIFHAGDPADALYILNRGCVRISLLEEDGREKIMALLKGGSLFGEDLVGPLASSRVQAAAHQECWVSLIPRGEFLTLLGEKPALARNFLRVLWEKLQETREDVHDISFLDTTSRLLKLLLKLGRTYGNPVVSRSGLVKLRVSLSHEHLARFVGANRPHVSTIMSDLKGRGLLAYQGRRLLLNVEALEEFMRQLTIKRG